MRGCGADGVATVRAPVCVGVALLLSLTGCSAGTGPTSGAAQPSPQEQATAEVPVDLPSLSAVAVYGRHAEARGKVDVRMRNAGSGDVEVETWQLRHPMVESVPAVTRRSRLPGGGDVVVRPLPFGPPRCTVVDPSGATVVLGLQELLDRTCLVPKAD